MNVTKTATSTRDDETASAEAWLDHLDPASVEARDATQVRAIIAAADELALADRKLREAVSAARAAGDSWTVIGAALGVTRQAAQMRFRTKTAARGSH